SGRPRTTGASQPSRVGDPRLANAGERTGRADEIGPRSVALPPPRERAGRGVGETIQRRGSTRQFGHAALTAEELGTALWAATRGFEADAPAGPGDPFTVAHARGRGPGAGA